MGNVNALDALYTPRYGGIATLGADYRPPARFEHGQWALVADLKPNPADGDGLGVRVFECRMPACSFKLEVQAGTSAPGRAGEEDVGRHTFVISTGTGDEMGRLIGALARAISEGMVGIDVVVGGDMATKRLMRLKVPAAFWDDHADRCPNDGDPETAVAREVSRHGNRVLIEGTEAQIRNLRSDAEFYCDRWGPDECPAGLKRSAAATLAALAKQSAS